jgi:hypothetical protein
MLSLWDALAQGEIYHSLVSAMINLPQHTFLTSVTAVAQQHGHLHSERMCGRETSNDIGVYVSIYKHTK